jgi:hypothetical protein
MSPRHEKKRRGPVLQEVKPMRKLACHAKMSSRAPSKPCLIATFVLRFLHNFRVRLTPWQPMV